MPASTRNSVCAAFRADATGGRARYGPREVRPSTRLGDREGRRYAPPLGRGPQQAVRVLDGTPRHGARHLVRPSSDPQREVPLTDPGGAVLSQGFRPGPRRRAGACFGGGASWANRGGVPARRGAPDGSTRGGADAPRTAPLSHAFHAGGVALLPSLSPSRGPRRAHEGRARTASRHPGGRRARAPLAGDRPPWHNMYRPCAPGLLCFVCMFMFRV